MPDLITWSQTWIMNAAAGLVDLLPFSYSFGAGMVSTVNPCGFAMLPAYLSLYLTTGSGEFYQRAPLLRLGKGLYIGMIVSLGFVVLFGIVGLGLAAGGQFLVRLMPWAGLLTGVGLAAVGGLLIIGRELPMGAITRLTARVHAPQGSGVRAFFLFGIAYGVASLACTLPIFLVVVGSAIAAGGLLLGFTQFVSYALGMSLVLVILTLGLASFRSAAVGPFRAALPYVERVSAVLILLMGSYLVYYWLTTGGILSKIL